MLISINFVVENLQTSDGKLQLPAPPPEKKLFSTYTSRRRCCQCSDIEWQKSQRNDLL